MIPRPQAVVRVPLDWTYTAEQAALLVRDDFRPFALIGRWAGGEALIGSEPISVAQQHEDPFKKLDEQPALADAPDDAVGGGWFGWLGYPLKAVAVDPSPPSPQDITPFELAFYDHLLHLDPDGCWWFEALWSEQRRTALEARLTTLMARAPVTRRFSTEPWQAVPSAAGHARAVAACRRRIYAGDLFQANVCSRLESTLTGAPIDLFVAGAAELRPDRAAFFGAPSGSVASLSPELFLERHGRRVRSAPIKGTRRRPADPQLAAAQGKALSESAKDRAENVMIVDLVRNDLGRVCEPGSIEVEVLCDVRPHAGVWHLVSEVCGKLRAGATDGDLVRAAFPPGSVTGAPKVAAMNVIAELESTARQLYTGALGFVSPIAGLELNVAIRTFEFSGGRAWLGVGGGIVAESDPAAEARECATKVEPLLRAIHSRLADEPAPTKAPELPRLGPRPVPRPDPARGLFETILVEDGRPVALDAHLERLAHSVRTLYRETLADGLEYDLLAAAAPHAHARLRIDVRPGEGPAIELTAIPTRQEPTLLFPVTVAGGLGRHKWADRRLLDALAASVPGEPLLCDLDGVVLESARANVFIVEPGPRVVTPPDDGRILPGVTRGAVLALARDLGYEARAEPIDLERLKRAQEMFVTGALSGIEPAQLAGVTGVHGETTATLARAWASARAPSGADAARDAEPALERGSPV